jgi:hypothetical protein
MTCTSHTKSNRRLSAKLAAGLAVSAVFVLGTLLASASAQDRRGDDHRGGYDRGGGHRHWSNGGYYPPPPVVYGTPYYNPPPVVYGPAIGVSLPGINIDIR